MPSKVTSVGSGRYPCLTFSLKFSTSWAPPAAQRQRQRHAARHRLARACTGWPGVVWSAESRRAPTCGESQALGGCHRGRRGPGRHPRRCRHGTRSDHAGGAISRGRRQGGDLEAWAGPTPSRSAAPGRPRTICTFMERHLRVRRCLRLPTRPASRCCRRSRGRRPPRSHSTAPSSAGQLACS